MKIVMQSGTILPGSKHANISWKVGAVNAYQAVNNNADNTNVQAKMLIVNGFVCEVNQRFSHISFCLKPLNNSSINRYTTPVNGIPSVSSL